MRWSVRLSWLLVMSALAALLIYVVANAWLESAGGRKTLERELTDRAGFPVRLLGDFDIMVFPALGVEGTELAIGGLRTDAAFVHAREYAVAVALRPLLAGELRVDSIRLAQGVFRTDLIPSAGPRASGSPGEALRLPAIGAFTVSDFVVVGGEWGYDLAIDELEIEGFEAGRETGFRIEGTKLGRVAGRFRWDPADALLGMSGTWSGALSDALAFSGEMDFGGSNGKISMRWPAAPADPGQVLGLTAGFSLGDEAVRLGDVVLSAGPQSIGGDGCLLLGAAPGLRLDLATDSLDIDRLPDLPNFPSVPGADHAVAAGFAIAVRLRAGELRRAGVVARNAVLSTGDDPDCSQPGRRGPEESG